MKHSAEIKDNLVKPAIQSGDIKRIEQTTAIWKSAVEAENAEYRHSQLLAERRSDSVRFWVPILAPLITAAAMIATLIFQIQQFRSTNQLSLDANEDAAWREVLKGAADTKGPQAEFSFTLLKSFFASKRYSRPAREIAITILGHLGNADSFRPLFYELARWTQWEDIGDLIRIGVNLNRLLHLLPAGEPADPKASAKTHWQTLASGEISAEIVREDLDQEIEMVGTEVIKLILNTPFGERGDTPLDLSDFQFGSSDLSSADLSGAILRRTIFFHCTVNQTVLDRITQFDNSQWGGTPWWECAAINQPLLAYLEENWPFQETAEYASNIPQTLDYYRTALTRLRAKNAKTVES